MQRQEVEVALEFHERLGLQRQTLLAIELLARRIDQLVDLGILPAAPVEHARGAGLGMGDLNEDRIAVYHRFIGPAEDADVELAALELGRLDAGWRRVETGLYSDARPHGGDRLADLFFI